MILKCILQSKTLGWGPIVANVNGKNWRGITLKCHIRKMLNTLGIIIRVTAMTNSRIGKDEGRSATEGSTEQPPTH